MKKIFIKLYLLLLLVLAVWVGAFLAVLPYLESLEKENNERIMKGVMDLAVREFRAVPPSRWPELVRAFGEVSGRLASVVPLADVKGLEEDAQQGLRDGELVSDYSEDAFYRRLGKSDQVLLVEPGRDGSSWYTGEDDRVSDLTVFLVSRELRRQDSLSAEEALAAIRPVFGFPVRLSKAPPAAGGERAVDRLARRGIWVDKKADIAWCTLPGVESYLVLGSLDEGEALLYYVSVYCVLGMFLVLIAAGAFLWTRPLWRDLDALTGVAERFKKGDLSARVAVSKGSAVHILAEEFNAMAAQVQREISYRIDLADAVSHELRSPLARLQFAFGLLDEATDAGARQKLNAEIQCSIEELDGLVEELLAFSRMEHGGEKPDFQEVNMTRWLETFRAGISVVRPEVEVAFRDLLEPEQATALAEERLLGRALGNLVGNAVRYARSSVEVSLERSGDDFFLTVEDDGCGIAEEHRENVFVPFIRLDGSRDRESGNHGLGLAIVRSIAERHRGRVTIGESPLGGALVRLSWPVQDASTQDRPTPS
ncbi:ATP-binding protein [Desulfoluna spongiiphila]|uniref:histidine kinase n=1 Tax=Desulfoluna spongiiphila TaxID=419481 RepID=A0A1G5AQN1_9BACT|nr:ATP-binding protein [Desulfoluna spongiiphila]SCX80185.1 two-component system, OmpR family, sensor histidine kinase RstB/two-component system, OmpR family, sensor kinase ParS [Desulfoluna spongiiphila]